MSTLVQRSFSGGEIAPALYARVDTTKYATGLRTCRNMLVMRHGGVQNRPGSTFVCETKTSTKVSKLIPFVFDSSQTYVLEFGDLYMRVIKDGAQLRATPLVITGVSQANPAVVTITGHGYSNGNEVYISGVVGMTQLNNRWFKVASVAANTFALQNMASVNLNSTAYTAYSSAGTAAKVYEISTPYIEADLSTLQYVQSADVITIVHPDYAPRELSRLGDTNWTLAAIVFDPDMAAPTDTVATGGGAGTLISDYVVTAINAKTGEESLVSTGFKSVISGITQASPGVVTTVAVHGLSTRDIVHIEGIVGMTELNGKRFRIVTLSTTTFRIHSLGFVGENTTSYAAYVSGGTVTQIGDSLYAHAAISTSNPVAIVWVAVTGASDYIIYKEITTTTASTGVYGYLGTSKSLAFDDLGTAADINDNPPTNRDLFEAAGDYPSTVTYIQQRRVFGNSDNDPEKVWLSQTGNFKNFTAKTPTQDDDSVSFLLAGRQVNSVRHIIDVGKMIVFTAGGEWSIQGDAAGIITPTDVNPTQYGYNGSGSLPPLVIGGNALFVQARGSVVRDLSFDFTSQNYRGNDLTIFSAHMFDEYTLVDWTYQQIPHSIVWVARSDGSLLGMTYVREHEMWAWHRHDFAGGLVENVTAIPNGNEDSLYLTIKRVIDGRTTRYIEILNSRQVSEALIEDAVFMDSALSYDGRHTGATTMTMSGGSTWAFDETLTLTASAATFASSYVGKQIHMTGSDGTIIRFTIDAYTSTTVVTGRPNKTVPAAMQSVAISTWAYAVIAVTGLWHLEGKEVSVFADGFVVANPNNAAYDQLTIANGSVTLDKAYSVIHVGLPYISDMETLDIDTPQGETLADKKKFTSKVSIFVEKSRGIFAGPRPPSDDAVDPLEDLYELKIRDDEDYDLPVELSTGVVDVNIKPEWNSNGRIFIRQVDPVPLAVLAVAPSGLYPFRG